MDHDLHSIKSKNPFLKQYYAWKFFLKLKKLQNFDRTQLKFHICPQLLTYTSLDAVDISWKSIKVG